MASPERESAKSALDEHARNVDALHHHLKSLTSDAAKHEALERAVTKHKAATDEFSDDVLGIVGNH